MKQINRIRYWIKGDIVAYAVTRKISSTWNERFFDSEQRPEYIAGEPGLTAEAVEAVNRLIDLVAEAHISVSPYEISVGSKVAAYAWTDFHSEAKEVVKATVFADVDSQLVEVREREAPLYESRSSRPTGRRRR